MHVMVLGSGVIGVTTAWYLARRGAQVTVIDHRPEARAVCGGNPCQFHSIAVTSIELAPEECETASGGVRVQGTVREESSSQTHAFEVETCDNGEPGHREFPQDRFEFFVPTLTDPQTGQPYCLREGFAPCSMGADGSRGALLTGGNLQVK